MNYKNPILPFDFSDPDAIRYKDKFYMVASSFNMLPGLPILESENLVDWKIINHAIFKLDKHFDNVRHGEGVWAPSIRYHNGLFYIIYPDPDRGIFEVHSKDIYSKFSEPHLIIKGYGIEDPCPIWVDDKCYMAVGFAKSRAGFNSCIGVYEVTPDLDHNIGDYKIVYDGHNNNPTIEGPKFYFRNDYYYIMCPAGSVKGGWQTCLRSKNIYGPYESKIVLFQGDSLVNGPHQGALIDLDDSNENFAFIHFQDKRAYGRIVHLQPAKFVHDWPLCGKINDELLCGTPVDEEKYPVDIISDYSVKVSDDFKGDKLSNMWMHPSNISDFYEIDYKLRFLCKKSLYNDQINLIENSLYTYTPALEFDVETLIDLTNLKNGNHIGFAVMGQIYKALDFYKENDKYYVSVVSGKFKEIDKRIETLELNKPLIKLNLEFRNKNIYDLIYNVLINDYKIINEETAYAGRWIGTRLGYYAYSDFEEGSADILYYKTDIIK
ncbi:MAG: glycoside hydrolase 43 family protein [Acholeplasmatales bacterium]|nr:glycoside hydrolase 43 family protein [Acholeplasmatales bacterium]